MVTNTPRHILAVSVITMTVIDPMLARGNIFDVYVMIAFGIIGYIMKSHGFILIPIVLGMILGPIAEKGLIYFHSNSAWPEYFAVYTFKADFIDFVCISTVISITIPIYRHLKTMLLVKATQE